MVNTYILLIRNNADVRIDVGSIGETKFRKGWYGYVGSSRSSDFTRLTRHSEVSTGQNDTRHWHIDYLNGHINTDIERAYTSTNKGECETAEEMDKLMSIEDFGCSDCDCDSHLFYTEVLEDLRKICEDISMDEFEPDDGIIQVD